MEKIIPKSVYYNTLPKHHSKITVKWLQMFNFDNYPKQNNLYTAGAFLVAYVYNLFYLFDLKFFTWEYVIKGVAGLTFSVGALAIGRVANICIDTYIKPKIIKYGKKHKTTKADKTDEANVA